MQTTDATHLLNFWPERNQVATRRGFVEHATDVGAGNVDTVVEYFDGTTRRLLAASATNIYNATSTGSASSLVGSQTSGRYQTAMMNGVMGLVNGSDDPLTYNGVTISSMSISGPDIDELIGIHVFKSRSYFWENGSQSFWYSATNALGGSLTEFELGQVAKEGGKLLTMTNWTVDGGDGVDDFAVFVMSSGEVIVYQGSDPGSAMDWSLVGLYVIPVPLDIRGVSKIGAEIMVLTDTDIVYLPSAFKLPSPPPTKLKGALELAGPTHRANTGWQSLFYPKRAMLILNIPISSSQFEQYVMNTATGAPARFTNMNARSWCVFNDRLFFGSTDGTVYEADSGTDDNDEDIEADARQAWSDLGTSDIKMVNSYRMVFSGTDDFIPGTGIGFDFENADVNRQVTIGGGGTPWGSPWGSPWGANQVIRQDWEAGAGSGQTISPQVSIGIQGERPAWYRTDLLVSRGNSI